MRSRKVMIMPSSCRILLSGRQKDANVWATQGKSPLEWKRVPNYYGVTKCAKSHQVWLPFSQGSSDHPITVLLAELFGPKLKEITFKDLLHVQAWACTSICLLIFRFPTSCVIWCSNPLILSKNYYFGESGSECQRDCLLWCLKLWLTTRIVSRIKGSPLKGISLISNKSVFSSESFPSHHNYKT